MKYGKVVHGLLVRRVNRFIAEAVVDGIMEQVHIKNTGRLKELLNPGTEVLLEPSGNPVRKTRFSLIAVAKNGHWVNVDSQAPNAVAYEAVKTGKLAELGKVDKVKREVTFGGSRFDLYFEKGDEKGFIEVKGVTLEENGVAMFPDAPTARGAKHVLEMAEAVREGYAGVILFIVQTPGCHAFVPNRNMDALFADALSQASRQGVRILAYDSIYKEGEWLLGEPLSVVV
ncbi:DNA/RNA nuclease SfsA [Paenibacillus sp. DYY-L-2]|uniref:DNA/RNA nuclease SfsA n=1 Tax=Paenibacillus sp. DYY-L-2 TaxID=3447013 RepID=UPI003F50BBEB